MQVPPIFSAIKVAGERAYDMAREGRAPVLEKRPARVDRFELVERPDADHAVFEVQSGKGVYMRSLARDLAVACGTVGHIAALRRMRVGPVRPDAGDFAGQMPARGGYPAGFPGPSASGRDRAGRHPGAGPDRSGGQLPQHGQAISLLTLMGRIPGAADPDGGLVRAMAGGRVIGLCRLEDGWLRPERLL